MRRRAGCGCLGCGALLFVTFAILTGSVGVLAGNWGGIAHPAVAEPATAVADIPLDYLTRYQDAGRTLSSYFSGWPVSQGRYSLQKSMRSPSGGWVERQIL